ncbi:MAG: DUF2442 domain-containing protein [Methylovulum sp.]|nr:DUF2442 domain-containing protein [Methylovulum sp.]
MVGWAGGFAHLLPFRWQSREGSFDMQPYLAYEAFEPLKEMGEFMKISNGGYFVEWQCGADLSADTIEARIAFSA